MANPKDLEEEPQMAAPTLNEPPAFTPAQSAPAAQQAAQGSIDQLAQMKAQAPPPMAAAPSMQLPMVNDGPALAPPGTNALGRTPQEEDALKKSLFRG